MSAKLPRGESQPIFSHPSTMPYVMDKSNMVMLLLINCLCTPHYLCECVCVCVENFVFIVSPMSCHFICSVALPYGAMGWSAVCDSGIS